jgi:predicted nucleic acid-binding protein
LNSQQTRCLVADSSVIIALAEINFVDIITMLRWEVIIPNAVYEEVVVRGRNRPGSMELKSLVNQGRVKVLAPRDKALVEALHDPLGIGEAEAVALAIENSCIVILDDRIARLKAKSIGLKVIGTVGCCRFSDKFK